MEASYRSRTWYNNIEYYIGDLVRVNIENSPYAIIREFSANNTHARIQGVQIHSTAVEVKGLDSWRWKPLSEIVFVDELIHQYVIWNIGDVVFLDDDFDRIFKIYKFNVDITTGEMLAGLAATESVGLVPFKDITIASKEHIQRIYNRKVKELKDSYLNVLKAIGASEQEVVDIEDRLIL